MLKGACNQLSLLTAFDESNKDKTLDYLYPIYAKALVTAELVKENEFPILTKWIKLVADTNINLLDLLDDNNNASTNKSIIFN